MDEKLLTAKVLDGPLDPKVEQMIVQYRIEVVGYELRCFENVAETRTEAQQVHSEMMAAMMKCQSYRSSLRDTEAANQMDMMLRSVQASVD
eukprot:CAMPEP_0167767518 /NCGR_PEP_ID=MMETSP0110_2-20121227/16103_1 /TAXON_ID=629695 /ORGANISM="Gymnochlora sp., Strain CCMP2014" /LENGTH=90 /DNA_ID=CAMNT_0007655983 /DNA_START=203 /DNA_END=472 /DNA_ORIENTATION=+